MMASTATPPTISPSQNIDSAPPLRRAIPPHRSQPTHGLALGPTQDPHGNAETVQRPKMPKFSGEKIEVGPTPKNRRVPRLDQGVASRAGGGGAGAGGSGTRCSVRRVRTVTIDAGSLLQALTRDNSKLSRVIQTGLQGRVASPKQRGRLLLPLRAMRHRF